LSRVATSVIAGAFFATKAIHLLIKAGLLRGKKTLLAIRKLTDPATSAADRCSWVERSETQQIKSALILDFKTAGIFICWVSLHLTQPTSESQRYISLTDYFHPETAHCHVNTSTHHFTKRLWSL